MIEKADSAIFILPITESNEEKLEQVRVIFGNQLKTSLFNAPILTPSPNNDRQQAKRSKRRVSCQSDSLRDKRKKL